MGRQKAQGQTHPAGQAPLGRTAEVGQAVEGNGGGRRPRLIGGGRYLARDVDWRTAYAREVPLAERAPPTPELRRPNGLSVGRSCDTCLLPMYGAYWQEFEWFARETDGLPDVRCAAVRCMHCAEQQRAAEGW